MSGLTDPKKRLALSIIDYLSTSSTDGTLDPDEKENIEVAISCIGDAFKVDHTDASAISDARGSQSLLNIFSVYEKMSGRGAPASSSASTSTPTSSSTSAPPSSTTAATSPSASTPESERLKSAGNAAMQQKDYPTAIAKYTEAITLSPTNPIYLSNRAAAYSAKGDHAAAVKDAEIAVAADPKYTKAWSRLGLARFAMGDARGSVEAYSKGIEYEGNSGSEAMKKGLETAKRELARMEEEEGTLEGEDLDGSSTARGGAAAAGAGAGGMPDLSSLAGMFGGGGAGGGGMPDLSTLMQNPAIAGMARNMMQNPEALSGLMNNPMIQNMMRQRQAGGGGGMPDMSQISQMMQDPAMQNLASQFMGGMGGAGRGAGR